MSIEVKCSYLQFQNCSSCQTGIALCVMASSEWGPTTELLTCIIFSGCLSGFLCDKVKVYSDVSEEHTTYPHFLGGKTSLGACYCNMEEGMVYTAWVGGFWKNQEFRMEEKIGLVPSHKPYLPTVHKVSALYSHQNYQCNKNIHQKNTIKPLCLPLFNQNF